MVWVPLSNADVFYGSFEWRRAGLDDYSVAEFEFDSATGVGRITGLNPQQGGYVTYGLWDFRLGVVDHQLYGGRVVVSSFDELVDFSNRSITILSDSGFGGPPEPYSITGDLRWILYLGSANGTISDGYSITDGAMFNAYYENGDVRNFMAVPEPANIALWVAMLAAGACLRRRNPRFEARGEGGET